jgi:hypothetical protein
MRFPESAEQLQKMHTKQLLVMMERARALPHGYCFRGEQNWAPRDCWTCIEDLKEILATREHRPNQAQRIKELQKKQFRQKKREKNWTKFNAKNS